MRIELGNLMAWPVSRPRSAAWMGSIALVLGLGASTFAGVTPESPEVQKLVNSGLAYLETNGDTRLGGKCLIGLAFLKAGRADHPRVTEALNACEIEPSANRADDQLDMYSNGLAIIFLCEASSQKHAKQIEWYLQRLKTRQKPHGGWGYHNIPTGDTSQTQYGAFSYWEANRHGFGLDGGSIDKLADWLLHTQDPEGCWGYQGQVSPTDSPITQDETNCSMLAAGMGSLYICADLFGMQPQA